MLNSYEKRLSLLNLEHFFPKIPKMKKYFQALFLLVMIVFFPGIHASSRDLDAPIITATAKGPNQINLTWSAVANSGWGYEIWIQSDGDSRYTTYTKLSMGNGKSYIPYWVTESHYKDPQDNTACQYPVFSLFPNTLYKFKVRSYGKTDAGVATYSSYSNEASATSRNYTVRYVRPDGNDANTGTSDTPGGAWRHIYKAAKTLTAGQVAIIHDGSYTNDNLVTVRSGTNATAKIVFMAYPGETPSLNAPTHDNSNFEVNIAHNCIVIDGIKVTTLGDVTSEIMRISGNYNTMVNMDVGGTLGSPIQQDGPRVMGNHNLIHGNYSHHFGNPGAAPNASGNEAFILWGSGSKYNIVQYNHFSAGEHSTGLIQNTGNSYNQWMNNLHDGGLGLGVEVVASDSSLIPAYNLIEGNEILDVGKNYTGTGYDKPSIEVSGNHNTIRRNILRDGGSSKTSSKAIELSAFGRSNNTSYNLIYNNVMYHNTMEGIGQYGGLGTPNNTIANNIIYYNALTGSDGAVGTQVYMAGSYSGTVYKNNMILYKTAGGVDTPGYTRAIMRDPTGYRSVSRANTDWPTIFQSNITTTPNFVDEAGKEFHLKSTSGLINAGISITDTTWGTIGYNGSAPDIGAFEYLEGSWEDTLVPPPPSNLRIAN